MTPNVKQLDLRLLIKISKLYYEQGLTQQQISDRLHLSRPKISRLLQQAHDHGLIQISVTTPPGSYTDLEQQLETQFDLREAVVVAVEAGASQEVIARELGLAAAQYLYRTLENNDVIGVSWGLTLNGMVNALRPFEAQNTQIVQIIGGLGAPEAEVHATDIAQRFARLLGGKLTLMPSPGVVQNAQAQIAMMSDRQVQRAFEMFSEITLAFVGIGVPRATSVVLRDGSIMSPEQLAHVLVLGAVGDICLRFFDADGLPVPSAFDPLVIGITLAQLQQIGRVIAVAGGRDKLAAVRGALRGRLIHVLITDDQLAGELVEQG
ncbi:MAG: sugar-binding transcriptional regulator [Chloroflexi bacterium]|nr:sugar-binding transcriptional regulator [Chloroflexota bacterium]